MSPYNIGSTTNVGVMFGQLKSFCMTRSSGFEFRVKVTLVGMMCKSMYEPYYLLLA
jgi:hypothetical protein